MSQKQAFDRAQARHDAAQPPPEDCGDGEHHFVTIKISSKDGETSITKRCEYCGEIVETLT